MGFNIVGVKDFINDLNEVINSISICKEKSETHIYFEVG